MLDIVDMIYNYQAVLCGAKEKTMWRLPLIGLAVSCIATTLIAFVTWDAAVFEIWNWPIGARGLFMVPPVVLTLPILFE